MDSCTITSEELHYHTIFCNAPDLKISSNHWRYIDWTAGGSHPKTLIFEDLPKMLASSAHFARKFDIDVDIRVLNEIDTAIEMDN